MPFLTRHLEIPRNQAPLARIGVLKKSLTADRSCAEKSSQGAGERKTDMNTGR